MSMYQFFWFFVRWGGFRGKNRTPGERWVECLQLTQLFSKIYLGPCWRKNRFSKVENLQKHPYFTVITIGSISLMKMRSNKGVFAKFWVLKLFFSSNSSVMDPLDFSGNDWIHCRHFGYLSLGVWAFLHNPPISQKKKKTLVFTLI